MSRLSQSLAVLVTVLLAGFVPPSADAAPADFPRPPQLEPDVAFWERIYSGVSTQGGLLHDDRYLDVVYEELSFPPGLAPHERAAIVDAARARYERILRHLATGTDGEPTADEARVRRLFPPNVSPAALLEAADHVRFQLGQSDRFREGLVRSGAWEHHVEQTLRSEGLPAEISALPHVESSFNPRAYSKVGAAGMWQFMRSTGKRWLRVDNVVDERLDPYKSTLAAAQFLGTTYSILGSWPLAITAYNHGTGGMQRAKEQLGTDDITTVVRTYQSPSFGFASRNFYVSFLAALEIDRNVDRFFGHVDRLPEDSSRALRLTHYMPVKALERTLGADRDTLRELNFSLLDPVWSGQRFVPRGFELRVPAAKAPVVERTLEKLAEGERYDGQKRDETHRVRKGETAERIATDYGLATRELLAFNGLASAAAVKPGMKLKVPPLQPVASGAAAPAPPAAASAAAAADSYVVRSGDTLAEIARRVGIGATELMSRNGIRDPDFLYEGQKLKLGRVAAEPVAAAAPEPAATERRPAPESAHLRAPVASPEPPAEPGPGLVPGAGGAASADPGDYAVRDGTAVVQGAETLGHFAEWLAVSPARLRELNGMASGAPLGLGKRIRLDLSQVDAATFEERRNRYHRQLQDEFFERYRITGQARYRLKSGESLWELTQRNNVPVWLLRQYNPQVDFARARAGTEILLPRVDLLPSAARPEDRG
jgi:membrane-bound lytic murein transglycosylase D